MLRHQLLDTTRGRIVTLLQGGELTTEEIATRLGVTASAVRAQMTAMERDGVIRRIGRRAGVTRPSRVFELTQEVEQLLSRAYIPLLGQLVRAFAIALPAPQLDTMLRAAGMGLAEELMRGQRPGGPLQSRVEAASRLLNEELGAVTRVERNGTYRIRGAGCPLSAVTGKHPAVCAAMETMVGEIVGVRVRECCDRKSRPRCCFEVPISEAGHRSRKRRGRQG
jgi:predicted ArsR family transcriptional regulator